jgi:hypothetical protein
MRLSAPGFLLKGCREGAERAVLGGTSALEFGKVTGDVLLVETVRAVSQQGC